MKVPKAIPVFFLGAFVLFVSAVQTTAQTPQQQDSQRNFLQRKSNQQELLTLLKPAEDWIKYPSYTDRQGWQRIGGAHYQQLMKGGEKYLQYEWKVVKATDYLAYERTGSRVTMEQPFGANNTALAHLFLAELIEGKGRFLDQIINGVWHTCEMSSWVLSAHLPVQRSRRSLQDLDEQIIDLTSGDLGSMLSWIHYFLAPEFDKVNPVIAATIRKEVEKRILVPYMERSDMWWQALQNKPGQMVNNWNPWCNFNVLACFLLMEKDPQKLAAAVHKTMVSTDQFINYTKDDGACEEGPSYWGHAAGKMYDYLQLLSYATAKQVDVFTEPKIRRMGEYIARSYIGKGWVVNFADASAKGGGNAGLIYRYGKAVHSDEMMDFSAYLMKRDSESVVEGRDIFRAVESIVSSTEAESRTPNTPRAAYTWYPQTEFCYMRAGDVFFGAKGGYNNESHNHNDVGSFIYYYKQKPFLIDAGVGTYTKFTFSDQRYSIWTMQSDYHNLPRINGYSQPNGAAFKSKNARFDSAAKQFSLDISSAYTPEAGIASWKLDYSLSKDGSLRLKEDFVLTDPQTPNALHFLCAVSAEQVSEGVLLFNNEDASIKMVYDPKVFSFSQEQVAVDDIRLSRVWGKTIYRIKLTDKAIRKKSQYNIQLLPQ